MSKSKNAICHKGFVFRVYPTAEQIELIEQNFSSARYVYNYYLEKNINYYKETGKYLSYNECVKDLTALKKTQTFLQQSDSLALQQSLRHLDDAFQRFFKGTSKYPNFKSKKYSKKSYTTAKVINNIRFENGMLRLPKVGLLKIKLYRSIPANYRLLSVTVSQNNLGQYFCTILCEYESQMKPVKVAKENVLGIDFKVACLYADSTGVMADMPKYYKKSCKHLAKLQRKLSRKQKKSKNYQKAKYKVAKLHLHTTNQRVDFLHKKSLEIANLYDLVCIEDLSVKDVCNFMPFKSYRKSVMDNGWYAFTCMLEYKLKDRGKELIKVPKDYPSSQLCHNCGYQNPALKDIRIRKWVCPQCSTQHDRDINAAINIRNKGYELYKTA